jgi:FAD/FMN-containing dehydrogenase
MRQPRSRPGAEVITFGHVADGNVHVNIVPAAVADGRHEDAVFSFVASLGGSISAERYSRMSIACASRSRST